MSRYCLDTSAYSFFMRGHRPAVDAIDGAGWIGVPVVVVGELWVGFLQGKQAQRNQAGLAEFLGNPLVEELPLDGEIGRLFAEIVVTLRKNGTPLPSNDIWIAATAAQAGATVLTYDAHFAAIERVQSLVLKP